MRGKMSKPILCLDFDGVIHSYTSKWTRADEILDPPVPGAIRFLREALKHFDVAILSSRSHQDGGINAMAQWLMKNSLSEGFGTEWLQHITWALEKPPAKIMLDDRAITFTGAWPPIKELLAFEPWNKSADGRSHTRAIINADAAKYMQLEQKTVDLMNRIRWLIEECEKELETLTAYLPIKLVIDEQDRKRYVFIGDENVPRGMTYKR